jgi:hypothetical protein
VWCVVSRKRSCVLVLSRVCGVEEADVVSRKAGVVCEEAGMVSRKRKRV